MTTYTIASWNVNSLRVRLPHVLKWLNAHRPDVLALQEIKMQADHFPFSEFQELGYKAIVSGQKAYNGVAILTRYAHENMVTDMINLKDPQRRVLGVTIQGIRIYNLYIPNGDNVLSDKYQYKLNWLNKLVAFMQDEITTYQKMIILGDFNIAPLEIDVYDPQQWEGRVLFSKSERQAFQAIQNLGFKDCYRLHNPKLKAYSWWDYRLNAFKRNLGCRIDHILSTEALSSVCNHCTIDSVPRGWDRPSDHAPVVACFSF